MERPQIWDWGSTRINIILAKIPDALVINEMQTVEEHWTDA